MTRYCPRCLPGAVSGVAGRCAQLSIAPCSLGTELQNIADSPANGYLNESQQELLAALGSADAEEADENV